MASQENLIACIESALQEGAIKTAEKLIALLKQSNVPSSEPVTPTVSTPGCATSSDIYVMCCDYLRTCLPGTSFNFATLADYIQSRPGITLDKTVTESERRERWRNNVSQSLEKLQARGYLGKGGRNAWYLVKRHP